VISPARLLVVDDNELNRDLLGRRLRRAGYEVIEAPDGRAALDRIGKEPIDLILLDIMMPDIDGLRVLGLLRETRPMTDLPVIMVTAKDRSEDLIQAFQLGANDYVTKPVDFAVLAARVQAQLSLRAGRAVRAADAPAGGPGSSGGIPAPPPEQPADPSRTIRVSLSSSRAVAMLWGSAEELPRGTRLGNYVISGLLGRGGMGIVYEAENPQLGRKAAVKILPRSLSTDAGALARFQTEARAAARIEHPNVVGVYDVGEWDGHRFIVMQFVAGGTAQARLDANGAFPWAEAGRIAAQACRGLAAAHACGVLHRDIKPSNIMLGADGTVKLGDFGLAKVLEVLVPASGTQSGELLGTPEFMSPEQCRNEPLDARSDVYSLGASYHALLTGRAPYEGNTVSVIYGQCFGDLPDPRTIRPDVPEACAAFVRKAMSKSPAARFPSAAAMIAALEAPPLSS
jgi:CheY-like chemotaxis protein